MNLPKYVPQEIKGVVYSMMSETQIKQFELAHEFDFAYSVKAIGRFRVNVFMQRGSIACAIRAVPTNKQSLEALGLPAIAKDLIMRPRGHHSCHRPDRQRQDHQPGGDDRLHQ